MFGGFLQGQKDSFALFGFADFDLKENAAVGLRGDLLRAVPAGITDQNLRKLFFLTPPLPL